MTDPRREYLAEVGARIHVRARVTWTQQYRHAHGYTYGVHLLADSGHRVSTFYSGRKWRPAVGQIVELTSTVEEHEAWHGLATTKLTRTDVEAITPAPETDLAPPPKPTLAHAAPWANSSLNPPKH